MGAKGAVTKRNIFMAMAHLNEARQLLPYFPG